MKKLRAAFILTLLICFSYTCKKENTKLALLGTINVSEITETTARCGGTVYYDGEAEITEKGLCWSKHSNPTTSDFKTNAGSGDKSFVATLTNLNASTVYYVRSFAINKVGIAYGEVLSFKTKDPSPLPVVITQKASDVTDVSAICGGLLNLSANAATVLETGICWNTSPDPTLENNKINAAPIAGEFTTTITNLAPNTTYYLRAYATNSTGTAYGEQVNLKTFAGTLTDYDGNTYRTVKIGTQEWIVDNFKSTHYRDGTAIPRATGSFWSPLATTGLYCYYSDDTGYKDAFGHIYTWSAVKNAHRLAPTGWHVPTKNDWEKLVAYLGGPNEAGIALKVTGNDFWPNNEYATNSSGFSALPGGYRSDNGYYLDVNSTCWFWSSDYSYIQPPYYGGYCFLIYPGPYTTMADNFSTEYGFYVRLIKD